MSAVARVLGRDCSFLEPGHFLWRPVGSVVLEFSGTVTEGSSVAAVLRQSQTQLAWTAWVCGLIAIVCCAVWLQRRVGLLAATAAGVGLILVSKAFLNYSQVGVSYVPALACLLGAIVILSRTGSWWSSVIAGGLLGTSVLLWGTFALALPVALATPLIFGTEPKRDFRRTAMAIAGGAATALVAAVWTWTSLDFRSLSDFSAWASTADHDISTAGVPRAVLGFARSYLETGDYGRLVKRFLLGDAADPVSLRELIGLPLLGIIVFYTGLIVAIVAAWRRAHGRRALTFFALNAIPVGLFAVAWQGGDLERYLPLVPGMALLAAVAFAAGKPWERGVLVLWLLAMVIPNAATLATPAVESERERVRSSLRVVESEERDRLLVFSHWQDSRVQFHRNYPPQLPPLRAEFYHLLTPGNASVVDWQSRVAYRLLAAFDRGTEVFVSQRLLAPVPRREWGWVDGDDDRVSWSDLNSWFAALSYSDAVGESGDGFLPLPPTAENRAVLERHARIESVVSTKGGNEFSPSRRCVLPAVVPQRVAAPFELARTKDAQGMGPGIPGSLPPASAARTGDRASRAQTVDQNRNR